MRQLSYLVDSLEDALLMIDREEAEKIMLKAIKKGDPLVVASDLIVQTLERIGAAWEDGSVALSQVYMSGVICEELVTRIFPSQSLLKNDLPAIGIAVFEDFHLLGKRIVYSSLRASGFDIIDLGNGLGTEQILQQVDEKQIKILLISVLMLLSAIRLKLLSPELKKRNVKLIVGGAPFRFDSNLWKEVGADASGGNSADAIRILTKILEEVA